MAGPSGQYGRWANAWEIERLTTIKANVDNAMGWMLTLYLDAANQAPPEERAALTEKGRQVLDVWTWMVKDLERWIAERCAGHEETPGC